MEFQRNIKFSIITVCFNSEKYIEKTLKSVLNQIYPCYEYIIIDGKSTDSTLDIVRRYEYKFKDRMKIISEPDRGIYEAMNKGIRMATGDFIGLINSDDFYQEDALKNIADSITDDKYLILYGLQRNLDKGKEVSIVFYNHEYIYAKMINHPTCFVSRTIYEDFGMFNLKYKSSADYEFILRIFQVKEVVFKPVYKIITNFELGGISSSQIGYRETAKLKLDYGLISKEKYYEIILRSKLYDIRKKFKFQREKNNIDFS